MTDPEWACCHWPGDAIRAQEALSKAEKGLAWMKKDRDLMRDLLDKASAEAQALRAALRAARQSLVDYAAADELANDSGYGCYRAPYPEIQPILDAIDAALGDPIKGAGANPTGDHPYPPSHAFVSEVCPSSGGIPVRHAKVFTLATNTSATE